MHIRPVLLVLVLTASCFLGGGRKKSKSGNSTSSLLDRASVFVERVGTGDKARLKFKTTTSAVAEIEMYPQGDESSRQIRSANSGNPASEFDELFDPVKEDALYYFELTIWTPGSSKDKGEKIKIKETPQSGKGRDNPNSAATTYKDLYVARYDHARRIAQVHRHEFGADTSVEQIRGKIAPKLGCQIGTPATPFVFAAPAANAALKRLSTREFATAKGAPNPDAAGVYNIVFNSTNNGLDYWQWIFDAANGDGNFLSRVGNQFLSVSLKTGAASVDLGNPNLDEVSDAFAATEGADLEILWTVDKQLIELSYVLVFVGRSNDPKSIFCAFEAKTKRGVVTQDLLRELGGGRRSIMAQLWTHQLKAADGWLISTSDWRTGLIDK
jgi:hypothetical protein